MDFIKRQEAVMSLNFMAVCFAIIAKDVESFMELMQLLIQKEFRNAAVAEE